MSKNLQIALKTITVLPFVLKLFVFVPHQNILTTQDPPEVSSIVASGLTLRSSKSDPGTDETCSLYILEYSSLDRVPLHVKP